MVPLRLHTLARRFFRSVEGQAHGRIARLEPEGDERRAELATLRTIWTGVRDSAGCAVVVEGGEGTGKSGLVRDLAGRVSNGKPNAIVLQLRADDVMRTGRLSAARLLFAAIHDSVGIAGASERALADFSTIVPALRERFPHLPSTRSNKRARCTAVHEVIEAVADDVPVLIVIDDFEQCDAATRDLILALVNRPPRSMLVVLTVAPDTWEALCSKGSLESPGVHRITLHARAASDATSRIALGRWGSHWHRWTLTTAAAGIALVAMIAATRARRSDSDLTGARRRLVVAAFENHTRDPQLDALGRIAADWLTAGAARTGLVNVSQPILDPTAGDGDARRTDRHLRLRRMARAARADLVVSGAYYLSGDSLRFEAQISDARTGERLGAVAPIGTTRHAPLDGVERLRQKTLASLAPWIDDRLTAAARFQSVPPSYESYLAFAEGLDRFYARKPEAAEYFARAYALDTTFTLPLLFEALTRNGLTQHAAADSLLQLLRPRRFKLAVYDRYVFEILAASLRGDAPAAYVAARAAAQAAPGSYASTLLPGAALGYNRPREALALLLPADSMHGEPGRLASYWAMVANAQHLVGDFERELESGRLVRNRFPHDPRYLHYEARALAALGRLGELDALLVESLRWRAIPGWGPPGLRVHITASDELRTHGRDSASRVVLERGVRHYERAGSDAYAGTRLPYDLARALYQIGRVDDARRILDRVARDTSARPLSEFELRVAVGCVAAAQRDTATVQEIDRWLRDSKDPYIRGANTGARARIAALLGRRDEAVRLLHDANAEGLGFAVGYHSQFEFATLRGFAPFEEWLRPKD